MVLCALVCEQPLGPVLRLINFRADQKRIPVLLPLILPFNQLSQPYCVKGQHKLLGLATMQFAPYFWRWPEHGDSKNTEWVQAGKGCLSLYLTAHMHFDSTNQSGAPFQLSKGFCKLQPGVSFYHLE
jgi:hypothetical protein